jgi:hypothetical protein
MKFDSTKPFDLPLLPPEVNFKHDQFVDVMLKTRTELGELNGYSYSLPNPLLLLSPAVIKESVASSNIENINTTMEEALRAREVPNGQPLPCRAGKRKGVAGELRGEVPLVSEQAVVEFVEILMPKSN